jgi:hypothetical protein
MATRMYKDRVLIWNADRDEKSGEWRPHVIISWTAEGQRRFHQMKGPLMMTREGAVKIARRLGQVWVDERQN